MAGIVSATSAQCLAARDATIKLLAALQQLGQGTLAPLKLSTEQITEIDALVDAQVAAIAPLNT